MVDLAAEKQKYSEVGPLAPYQARFAQDFLSGKPPIRHLLIASPGTGKTTTAIFLAKEIAKVSANYRILFIGPRTLAAMYESRLALALADTPVFSVTRSAIRELEATRIEGKSIWPAPAAAVVGIDTARHEDVLHNLCSASWDLVVIEEVRLYGRARWTLLRTVLKNRKFRRVLLISATSHLKAIAPLLEGVALTQWTAGDFTDWQGQPLFGFKETEFSTVVFQRSQEEISVAHSLLALLEELSATSTARIVRRVLLKQASSSPLALERTLTQLRNSIVHTDSKFALQQSGATEADDTINWTQTDADLGSSTAHLRSLWRSKSKALARINRVLERLDAIPTDTKLETLESLIARVETKESQRVCVFCTSQVTAKYLETVITERGQRVWRLTGEDTPNQFITSLTEFRLHGGVLIATIFALQGFELHEAQIFIHYDPPRSNAEMRVRVSRNPSGIHYILKDDSGAIPNEWNKVWSHLPDQA
jgi:superfamily II DNA or RNA helicase